MNEFGYYLGVFKRIWDILSFPLCVLLLAIFVYKYQPPVIINSVAPVVTVDKEGKVRLLSENSDEIFKEIAIKTADKIAAVIFSYSNLGEYVSNAAEISNLFIENSKVSRTFRDIVQNNLQSAKKETAVFNIDKEDTIAAIDPKYENFMVVMIKGFQTISTDAGTNTKKVRLNLTFYFNENRGKDGEIFKVYDMSFE